ncbi:MAG: caspase family protein [Actinobacteria bacterium]|nr:caspase family protein [Actinomycetota bacterium]MBW3648277.1 caspase family protein [Actinomycetota bacterium]
MTDPAARRRTRRVVEATLWTVAAAVLVGAGVFLLIDRPTAEAGPVAIPVVTAPSPSPSPSPSPVPSPSVVPVLEPPPVPRADPNIRAAAQPELDVESILGPPPGPQNDPRPLRTAAPADRYAFLVGVTDYRPPTKDTIGSANDVRYIAAELEKSGWLPQNIRMVTDGQATGAAIREGMSWLTAKSTPGTFALFHYSGHVKQKGGTKEALWPVDRAFIDDREVTALLGRSQGRLWVDIAGCEAGSFMDGLPSDRVLFSGSSKGTEKSYEYPPWARSVWTGLVFDLGLAQRQADADGNGRTTMGETLRYSQYYAQAITLGQKPYGRQTPQFAGAPDLGWTLADPPA